MLTRDQKKEYRSDLFRYLDGLACAPTGYLLWKKGILKNISEAGEVSLKDINEQFKTNEGYLNVALRIMCSQGWLDYKLDNQSNTVSYLANDKTEYAIKYCAYYEDVVKLLSMSGDYHPRLFQKAPFEQLVQIFERYKNKYGLTSTDNAVENEVQAQVLKHIEGAITAPSIVALGMSGMFHKYFMEASFRPEEFHKDPQSFATMLDFFAFLGWFKKTNDTYSFTDKGLFFAKRASAFGVTVSYQNTFRHLEQLLFGDPHILRNTKEGEDEKHVDRTMNVWGSGGAHAAYFKKVDEIIIGIFNRPIHEQPKGIVDMGCGNGAYLQHLFEVIEQRTLRGTMLEDHPVFLVGADYNQAALKVTRANLISADIWAKVIWGDIGRPDLLAKDLDENYGIDLKDLLNVRTFLDHNRIWEAPKTIAADRASQSTGSFVYRGERLANNHVEDSLLEHFLKWTPYVKKFGLLLIELHTVSPTLVAANLGRTAATAYDATHGFSDQYIVELPVFLKVAKEAGLTPDPAFSVRFPDSDLATVSINLLTGR